MGLILKMTILHIVKLEKNLYEQLDRSRKGSQQKPENIGKRKHLSAVMGHPKTHSQHPCTVGTLPSKNWRYGNCQRVLSQCHTTKTIPMGQSKINRLHLYVTILKGLHRRYKNSSLEKLHSIRSVYKYPLYVLC